MNQPDPRKHQLISFLKSGIRIGGCLVAAIMGSVWILAVSLLVAEIVGVYEELV
jgi:hypothetical protein